ncbi:DNA cytosine methyltransferase [Kitasatospora herbaricolor]|uniref:DNA cytosine methyltransferase n=1 Tax=Kitasatospora herbaricolor TaxID=68217 RepID=UPI0036DBBFA7
MTIVDPPVSADDTSIKVIDLFAGCGGFSTGFHAFSAQHPDRAPFRSLAAVEFDQAAAGTFALNFPDTAVHAADIATFDGTPFAGEVDVIMGGPPCQGFSGLNMKNNKIRKNNEALPDDPRNRLWREYMRVVTEVQPKIFVLENVDRFLRSEEFAELEAATTKPDGQLRNYRLTVAVLNAADYGAAQTRRRAVVIATRTDLPPLQHPAATHSKTAEAHHGDHLPLPETPGTRKKDPWETVERIFSRSRRKRLSATELPVAPGCAPLGVELPGVYLTTDLHIGRRPIALSLARYAAIPPGGNRNHLRGKFADIAGELIALSTPSWDAHNKGAGDVMGRLHLDRPSVTIRTEFFKPEKGRYLHPTEHRPITHFEAALIQGFPDDYKWCGTKVQIARQIGNAVPVKLGYALAKAIHQHLHPEPADSAEPPA